MSISDAVTIALWAVVFGAILGDRASVWQKRRDQEDE